MCYLTSHSRCPQMHSFPPFCSTGVIQHDHLPVNSVSSLCSILSGLLCVTPVRCRWPPSWLPFLSIPPGEIPYCPQVCPSEEQGGSYQPLSLKFLGMPPNKQNASFFHSNHFMIGDQPTFLPPCLRGPLMQRVVWPSRIRRSNPLHLCCAFLLPSLCPHFPSAWNTYVASALLAM